MKYSNTLLVFALAALPFCARGTQVLASSFGYNTTDCTAFLTAAFTANYDTIVVDYQPAGWTVGPLSFSNLTNRTILFQPNTVLKAKVGAFPATNNCLLSLWVCQNINLLGYGATFQMNKPEYTSGQWRHCLQIRGCTNVTVLGLTLRDSGGDGIFVGANWQAAPTYSKNITIRDCWCDNNRRQGISVISAWTLTIQHCRLTNTNGNDPQAGIDFEPNGPTDRLVSCKLLDCEITGNAGAGIKLDVWPLNASSTAVGLTVERCYVAQNLGAGFFLNTGESNADGNCTVKNCFFEKNGLQGLYVRKNASDVFLEMANCALVDNADAATLYPIYLRPAHVSLHRWLCDKNQIWSS